MDGKAAITTLFIFFFGIPTGIGILFAAIFDMGQQLQADTSGQSQQTMEAITHGLAGAYDLYQLAVLISVGVAVIVVLRLASAR